MEIKKSPIETLKENSQYLRGTIRESLAADSTHFPKDDGLLLKQHGTYEQDDRDLRQKLLAEKKEPAYSMMVRSKIVGGKMTAAQYLVHHELAEKYGNGTLRLTTRQGIQFHGVLKKNVKAVIRKINESLLTTLGACGDNVRNVMACPAPFNDRKKAEIFRHAQAVSDQFLSRSGAYHEVWLDGENFALPAPTPDHSEPFYGKTYLPRKFKIAFAFPDDNCVDVYTHDLGIVPEIVNGELTGFNILVGGGFGMTHGVATTYPRLASPLCFVAPGDLLEITKAVVLVQKDHGNRADRKRARMKYLIDEKGLDWFREEVEKRFGKKTEPAHDIHFKTVENHLGWQDCGAGTWAFGLYVENGRVKDEGNFRLKTAIKAAAEKFNCEIDITAQQDVLFAGFKESQKKELEDLLLSYGVKLPIQLSALRRDAMACPALPTCGLAISESERVLPGLIDQLEKKAAELDLADQRILVRMTGCPNGCARPYNSEIAFVGRTIGTYAIFVGGSERGDRLNMLLADKVPLSKLPEETGKLFSAYKRERRLKEGFGDFCHRVGLEHLQKSLSAA